MLNLSQVALQTRSEGGRGIGGSDDGNDLEVDEILPPFDPLLKQCWIITIHDLVATHEIRCDPAAHVTESFRREPALIAKAAVNGNRVAFEILQNQIEHAIPP